MKPRISRLSQLSASLAGIVKHVRFFFDINGLKYMVFASLLCIGGGGVAIHFAEGMSIPDGIWWAFVTATTVGYGDISPSTPFGRTIAAILMLVGIGLIGSLTSTITAMFFSLRESRQNGPLVQEEASPAPSDDPTEALLLEKYRCADDEHKKLALLALGADPPAHKSI